MRSFIDYLSALVSHKLLHRLKKYEVRHSTGSLTRYKKMMQIKFASCQNRRRARVIFNIDPSNVIFKQNFIRTKLEKSSQIVVLHFFCLFLSVLNKVINSILKTNVSENCVPRFFSTKSDK